MFNNKHNIMENKRRSESFDKSVASVASVALSDNNTKTSVVDKNTILKTKYKYKKNPIGQGSFATVFLAVNKQGEKFALKRIDLNKLDSSRIDKFMLELEISRKLTHKNIVKCYDVIKTDCHWFLINELCDAGTFEGIIKAFDKLDIQQREAYGHHYLTQLKDALCYLHKNGIVHRDLKPANILISRNIDQTENSTNILSSETQSNNSLNEVVKLADFGLARYFDHKPQNVTGYDEMITTMCGSPIYMAPELILEMGYNIKADLWSFGVIMYELLYGTNPYNYPRTIVKLAELMKSKQINFPQTLSPLCVDLLKKLLKVDPVERISWEDFGNHDWFNQVLISESDEDIENVEKSNNTHVDNSINNAKQSLSNTLNQSSEDSNAKTIIVTKENGSKTIEIDIKDRTEAFKRARNMKDTFQLLKDRGRVFSDIKKDPEVSPYSSTEFENSRKKKESSTGSMLYDMSENFLDTHFGNGIDDSYVSLEETDKPNKKKSDGSQTENTKKIKEYKESVGTSVIRILYESVGFWVSNKSSLT